MINLVNRAVKSANLTVGAAFVPLRCEPTANYPSRTFVEIHVPDSANAELEWAYSNAVTFGERIARGDTHTFSVGPNVDVLVRAVSGSVAVVVHEGH